MGNSRLTSITAVRFGQVEYACAWELQKRLHQRVADGEMPGILLLLEHPHVYTLGRRGRHGDVLASPARLRALGAEVHFIDRGGEATYHGPGQLVGYPIIDLRRWGMGPVKYVRMLEQTIIATLAGFGIHGESEERPTGVWVGDAKIAAIGVKISRGVTMHGFALNVAPDLSYFDHIVPCGMPGSRVTSLARELRRDASIDEVVPALARRISEALDATMQWAAPDEVLHQAEGAVAPMKG